MIDSYDSPEEVLAKLSRKTPRPGIGSYVAPRDELEESLCQIWGDVLAIEPVGRGDNILSLGGDSFHMLLISARLVEVYGMDISIAVLFDYLTVESMAGYLRRCMHRESAASTESEQS